MTELTDEEWKRAADAEARLLGIILVERVRFLGHRHARLSPNKQKRHLFLLLSDDDEGAGQRGPSSICQYSNWNQTRVANLAGDPEVPACKVCRQAFSFVAQGFAEWERRMRNADEAFLGRVL